MISYIIVDDESIAHRIIEDYAQMMGTLELKSNCYDALQAIQFLNSNKVDLIFLDLNMPKLKGFDFLRTLEHPPKVIVTTAYSEHAIEGFDLNVTDYLLKPFRFDRFVKAVNKIHVIEESSVEDKATTLNNDYIMLKGDKKQYRVKQSDIYYIEANRNYSKVYLHHQTIEVHKTISSFEEDTLGSSFLRIHKSFIINTDYISEVEGQSIRLGQYEIPIGQSYRSQLNDFLK